MFLNNKLYVLILNKYGEVHFIIKHLQYSSIWTWLHMCVAAVWLDTFLKMLAKCPTCVWIIDDLWHCTQYISLLRLYSNRHTSWLICNLHKLHVIRIQSTLLHFMVFHRHRIDGKLHVVLNACAVINISYSWVIIISESLSCHVCSSFAHIAKSHARWSFVSWMSRVSQDLITWEIGMQLSDYMPNSQLLNTVNVYAHTCTNMLL